MADVAELMSIAKDNDDKKQRKQAVKDLGDLDYRFDSLIDLLNDLEQNDPDKGVRKEAKNSLKDLSGKPMRDDSHDDEVEVDDSKIGEDEDLPMEVGQYDVDSSMTDKEEDRIEASAEGKGLKVVLSESNSVTMDYFGTIQDRSQSTGKVIVQNTGNTNRISGVDLILENTTQIKSEDGLEDAMHVGVVAPGNENNWERSYLFENASTTIKVEQTFEDTETHLTPNFIGDEPRSFVARIAINNTTDKAIYNITGTKKVNPNANVADTSITSGSVSSSGDEVTFTIDEIAAGDTAVVSIELSASLPEDVNSYSAGEVSISYQNKGTLDSGLSFKNIDGVSTIRQGVNRRQRETEPGFYDCRIVFQNKSEFIYDLNQFTVFADTLESQQIVLEWDGTEATEDEREIVPGEKIEFKFIYESPEGTPSFGNYVNYSVQHEIELLSTTTVTLPSEELKFMALSIVKAFLTDGEEVNHFELPSYRETEIPTVLTVTGVGTYPIEAVEIKDDIPDGFEAPSEENILVSRGANDIPPTEYVISVTSGENGGHTLELKLEHLEDTTSGGIQEGDQIQIKYVNVAKNPEPQEEPIFTKARVEGYIYLAPDSRVKAESELESVEFVVIHLRDDIDIGKMIEPIDHEGMDGYRIVLDAENAGTSTQDLNLEDLIPNGFRYIESSMSTQPDSEMTDPQGSGDGTIYGWKFASVKPGDEVSVNYVVVEDSADADPRKLQSVHRG